MNNLTPAQRTLARYCARLTGTIEDNRWNLAELADDAAEANIPAWAEVIASTCRRSPSTVYEWRRAWALRKTVSYRYVLPISFYVSAANAASAGADTDAVVGWLETCAGDRTITLESARANLPRKAKPEPPTPPPLAEAFRVVVDAVADLAGRDDLPEPARVVVAGVAEALWAAMGMIVSRS